MSLDDTFERNLAVQTEDNIGFHQTAPPRGTINFHQTAPPGCIISFHQTAPPEFSIASHMALLSEILLKWKRMQKAELVVNKIFTHTRVRVSVNLI